ncbi:MAG TPA: alpha/beta hydrolase-fold protein [Kofleriaceae bacterium]
MRGLLLVVPALVACWAGCGDDKTTDIKCSGGAQGSLSLGSPVTVTGGDDLNGAAIAADDHTTIPTSAVSIACAADIAPSGYIALGPAVAFGAEGTWSDRPFELTLPYKMARMPANGTRGNVRIVAKRPGGDAFFPPVSNRTLDDTDTYASKATFRGGELTTYQVVAAADAGQTHMEQFGWNAITGVSMGGNAAMAIALRHPDRFDVFGDMGGEPGPSQVYTLSMVRDFVYGGFCDAASGQLGQLCPNHSTKPEQFEIESDFEHMLYQSGSGVGLTLDRSLYMKGTRDMARALSNPALYNPMNAYAPPGVDFSYFATPPATRCDPANTVTLTNFYDREYNPTGSKPVITFCDGGDSATQGLGVFDPALPQTDPAELVLAVDLNGNGKRDPGEPVITNAYEPFQDVGADGLADKDEPGYDPVTNPDPNHDDYHYLRNPNGTEGNGTRDLGEPFEDVGLDGVAGTCQAPAAGCYDFGEGNGTWDVSPNVLNWYKNDFNHELAALTPDQRAHMAMWFDAGVRDFLNNSVSSNQAVGQAMGAYGLPFGVYDGFGGLVAGANDATYDFTEVEWKDLPKQGYLRYGNPDASPADIAAGDGRHVGTANQIIYRIETAFAFIDKHLPDGDRDDSYDGGQTLMDQSFVSPTTGRDSPYALFLPPGYNDPANATKRYPVVYVLHGYGQQPNDLVALSAVIANHMIATEPLETRIQKFIMVFVDGRCRPGSNGVPVDTTGDQCEQGTFYVDAPLGGKARAETNMLELMDHIDATYRTKQASAAEVAN